MESIGDLLNLDTWTKTEGRIDVDGPVCPHCKYRSLNVGIGVQTCGFCEKQFDVKKIETPLGPGFMTTKL